MLLKIVVMISVAISFLCLGLLIELKTKEEPIEINYSINLILPKDEQDLKKQILFNAVQKTMLQEMERMKWFKKDETRTR